MVMDHERDDIDRHDEGYDEYSEENRGAVSQQRVPEQQAPQMSPLERALHVPTAMEENPVRELFTPGNLKMKTEIPPGLIIPLARAYVIAKKTGSAILTNFCDEILLLQISKDRRGRIEFMESVVASRGREDDLD